MFRFKNINIHIFIVDPFVYHVIVRLKGVELLSELIESWDQERKFIDSGAKVKKILLLANTTGWLQISDIMELFMCIMFCRDAMYRVISHVLHVSVM